MYKKTELIVIQNIYIREHVDCTCCIMVYIYICRYITERTKKKGWKCLKRGGMAGTHVFKRDAGWWFFSLPPLWRREEHDEKAFVVGDGLGHGCGLGTRIYVQHIEKQKRVWWII